MSKDGHASDCQDVTDAGRNAFSKALLHALEQPAVQFKPMTLAGAPISGRHVFLIIVRPRSTQLGSLPPFQSAPDPGYPIPVETRPNYHPPIPSMQGNTPSGAVFYGLATVPSKLPFPEYPRELIGKSVAGAARAVCRIEINGRVTNCVELCSSGSEEFGTSFVQWLTTPGVLARPLLLNGVTVAGSHEFEIHFAPVEGF